ncbi:MAG: hypothetical protein IPG24_18385 [Leptospiraceae bacterium]|nr:hypothetical protein [Leptospiraceae bacterium]
MYQSIIILTIVSAFCLTNCGGVMQGKDTTNNTGILAVLLASRSTSTAMRVQQLGKRLSQVTNPTRTQYKVSGRLLLMSEVTFKLNSKGRTWDFKLN